MVALFIIFSATLEADTEGAEISLFFEAQFDTVRSNIPISTNLIAGMNLFNMSSEKNRLKSPSLTRPF